MATIKKTFVFESREAFIEAIAKEERDNEYPALFNGVSKEFAKEHPNYETNNETNTYCWNCLDCVHCFDCDNCTNCAWCGHCKSCDNCTEC